MAKRVLEWLLAYSEWPVETKSRQGPTNLPAFLLLLPPKRGIQENDPLNPLPCWGQESVEFIVFEMLFWSKDIPKMVDLCRLKIDCKDGH